MGVTTFEHRSVPPPLAMAVLAATALDLTAVASAQQPGPTPPPVTAANPSTKLLSHVFDYLNMDTPDSGVFNPLTQRERTHRFGKSLINPVWYAKGALSAVQNQWRDIPEEWEQGASGLGKRYGDIMGQYAIRKTVTFGFESMFHEDNRYFPSRKTGFWSRTGYALSSGILARKDNGRRYPSASLLLGYASGSYLSRFWQPSGSRSVGDAAVSFGVAMGWNIGFGVLKEFLPDMLRPLTKKGNTDHASSTSSVSRR